MSITILVKRSILEIWQGCVNELLVNQAQVSEIILLKKKNKITDQTIPKYLSIFFYFPLVTEEPCVFVLFYDRSIKLNNFQHEICGRDAQELVLMLE